MLRGFGNELTFCRSFHSFMAKVVKIILFHVTPSSKMFQFLRRTYGTTSLKLIIMNLSLSAVNRAEPKRFLNPLVVQTLPAAEAKYSP